jgi:hypothetical protein
MTFRLSMLVAVPLVLASSTAYAGPRSPPLSDGTGPVIVAPTTDEVRGLYSSQVRRSAALSDGSGSAITAPTTDQVRALVAQQRAPAAPAVAPIVLASTASFDKSAPVAASPAADDPAPQKNACTCAQHQHR